MGNSKFLVEFKKEVCDFTNDHTYLEAETKFGISRKSIQRWRESLSYPPLGRGFRRVNLRDLEFKHEVCQYYDNHTAEETLAKFDVGRPSLFKWRRELGYRNKSRGYNLYTEQLQPSAIRRERRNFVMTRKENGDLQAQIVSLNHQLNELYIQIEQLKRDTEIVQSIRNLFNH